MNTLPRAAQFYLIGVYLTGCAAAVLAAFAPKASASFWEIGIFLTLAALIGRTKIRLLRHHRAEDGVSMSLGYVLTFAALLRFGPAGALLVGAVGSLSNGLYPKRQPSYQLLFNVTLTMLEAMAAGQVFPVPERSVSGSA